MSSDALEGKRILSVDDSATIRKYLRNILAPFGVVLEEAETGEGALKVLESSEDFDMILLDLELPDMGGMEVLERLRKHNDTTTIVVLTGTGDIRSASVAVKAGADGYIEKHHLPKMDHLDDLFYALEQSMDHRAGIVARKQLEAVRADFYSMVTHDLRNPTGAILLSLDMLMNGTLGPLLPKQQEFLSIAQTASEKLLALINDYLDFSQIDSGYLRLDKSDTELRRIIEATVKLAELQAEAKKQALTVELPGAPLPAHADGKRLQQVVENLLSNAIKYTPAGGSIAIRLYRDNDSGVIVVSDTGQGIPKDQLPALFTKYHRIPGQATRGIVGTGLGLAIVKEIVEAHGGSVQAESEGVPGKGSTFTVRIPLESKQED